MSEAVYLDPGAARVVVRVVGDGAPLASNSATGNSLLSARRALCEVCGEEVELSRRRPRERHPECADVYWTLNHLERAIEKLGPRRSGAARRLRARLQRIANSLPVNWQRPRDSRGRFVKGGGE